MHETLRLLQILFGSAPRNLRPLFDKESYKGKIEALYRESNQAVRTMDFERFFEILNSIKNEIKNDYTFEEDETFNRELQNKFNL